LIYTVDPMFRYTIILVSILSSLDMSVGCDMSTFRLPTSFSRLAINTQYSLLLLIGYCMSRCMSSKMEYLIVMVIWSCILLSYSVHQLDSFLSSFFFLFMTVRLGIACLLGSVVFFGSMQLNRVDRCLVVVVLNLMQIELSEYFSTFYIFVCLEMFLLTIIDYIR